MARRKSRHFFLTFATRHKRLIYSGLQFAIVKILLMLQKNLHTILRSTYLCVNKIKTKPAGGEVNQCKTMIERSNQSVMIKLYPRGGNACVGFFIAQHEFARIEKLDGAFILWSAFRGESIVNIAHDVYEFMKAFAGLDAEVVDLALDMVESTIHIVEGYETYYIFSVDGDFVVRDVAGRIKYQAKEKCDAIEMAIGFALYKGAPRFKCVERPDVGDTLLIRSTEFAHLYDVQE